MVYDADTKYKNIHRICEGEVFIDPFVMMKYSFNVVNTQC